MALGLRVITNSELIARERSRAEAMLNLEPVTRLSAHVQSQWVAAREEKRTVQQDLLKSLRQRDGIYDADVLQKIRQIGGSEIYMKLTATKCRAAESWIKDVLAPAGEKPWTLDPTPMPSLPPELEQAIRMSVIMEAQQAAAMGAQIQPGAVVIRMDEIRNEIQTKIQEAAKEAAEAMERKIEDQLAESQFHAVFPDFISYLVTFRSAFLKGPVIRKRKLLEWDAKSGQPVVSEKIIYDVEAPNPLDIYPSPGAVDVNDGWLFEFHRLQRGDVAALLGCPGYNEDAVRAVLDEYGRGGLREWTQYDTEREMAERKEVNSTNKGGTIDALEGWGSVSGELLIEWGLSSETIDPAKEYEINAWKIGRHIIKAVLNPDPLGRRPYYKTSFENLPGAFWGNAPPDLIRDVQQMCNYAARSLANNMSIASGPQVDVDVDRLPAGEPVTEMYPWKIWQTTSKNSAHAGQAPAIRFFQPDMHAQALLSVFEFFERKADDVTGIPAYSYGSGAVSGAGRTASGMAMLMNNASKGIKQVVQNIDRDVIGPLIERFNDYNLLYDPDPTIKGDCQVVARGALSLINKETAQMRRNEFLQATNNPVDLQIIGLEGRSRLLREAAKSLDMPVDEVVPSPEDLRMRQMLAMAQAGGMAGGPGPQPGQAAPETLDAAGNPVAGQDVRLFNPEAA